MTRAAQRCPIHKSAGELAIRDRHVSLEITNPYAEITVRMKEAAMKLCEPPTTDHAPRKPAWRDDAALLTWLASL
jgi:hypothetical protein